jgi:hypothetical protein
MWNNMSGGMDELVPNWRNGGMITELIRDEGGRVPFIAIRGGMTYHLSRQLFSGMGMASKFITPLAIATTILDIA